MINIPFGKYARSLLILYIRAKDFLLFLLLSNYGAGCSAVIDEISTLIDLHHVSDVLPFGEKIENRAPVNQ